MALAGRSNGVGQGPSSPPTGLHRTRGSFWSALNCLVTQFGPVKRLPVPSGYRSRA